MVRLVIWNAIVPIMTSLWWYKWLLYICYVVVMIVSVFMLPIDPYSSRLAHLCWGNLKTLQHVSVSVFNYLYSAPCLHRLFTSRLCVRKLERTPFDTDEAVSTMDVTTNIKDVLTTSPTIQWYATSFTRNNIVCKHGTQTCPLNILCTMGAFFNKDYPRIRHG